MDHTTAPVRDVWPPGQDHLRPIITTCYLVSVAVLSALLSRRWIGWNQIKRLPVAKLLVLAVLVDSLLFVFCSAILILGVGTSFSDVACKLGIWWCIILYASSKVIIYAFLSEKLYAVYSITPTRRIPRWQSTQYKIAIAFLFLWIGVAVVMIVGRIAEIRQRDSACVIGLRLYSTVPMLAVDVIVNIYLTAAFVLPVYRSKWNRAQRLAFNSCIAAVVALVTSFANIAILTVQHGHQLSWVCLGSCGLDVSINAIILYIVTSSSTTNSLSTDVPTHQPSSHLAPPTTTQRLPFSAYSLDSKLAPGGGGVLSTRSSTFGDPTTGGGIHVSEEIVRVEEEGEDREKQEEWLKVGRRSRLPSTTNGEIGVTSLHRVEFERRESDETV